MSRRKQHTPPSRPPRSAAPDNRQRPAVTPRAPSPAQGIWIGFALAAITAAVFAPVGGFEFVSWDDPWYVSQNPHVAGGLTWPNAAWAFTSGGDFYWHPLTWLSHMLDVTLYGMNAGGHHITSVLLHVASTLLLFWLLRDMTGTTWRSALVAAFFGVHPLHVESVAWVAERKDVLSTLFFLLTLGAYLRYVRQPGWARYLVVAGTFCLGLMAKPMVVSLPVVLLLLDVWPLGRWALAADRASRDGAGLGTRKHPVIVRLIAEKVPLLVLALASGVGTFIVQRQVGAVAGLSVLPMTHRVSNAVVSYGAYLQQTVFPANLAAFYPYPAEPPAWWLVCLVAAGLTTAVALAARAARTRPYLIVGVLWYLITLFPVIGILQAGDQLRADRFTYVPLVGVFIVVAWGVPDLLARRPRSLVVAAAAGGAAVLAFAVGAHAQVRYWKDTPTLWSRALAVTTGNHRAHAALGDWLAAQGKMDEARTHYQEAIRLAPYGADYRHALGLLFMRQGRIAEAGTEFDRAVRLDPRHVDARIGLGATLARQGLVDEAILQYTEALRIDPNRARAHDNLGLALMERGRLDEARRECGTAVRLDVGSADARQCLGLVLTRLGEFDEAATAFAAAVRLDPGSEAAYVNLGVALRKAGRTAEALKALEGALRINPANEAVRQAVGELAGRVR